MGKAFVAQGENQTQGTGSVLVAFQTAAAGSAAASVRILRLEVSQSANTTSAQCRLVFSTRDTAGTLTTTSVTAVNSALGGPASGLTGNTSVIGGTARIGITSSADTGGTYTNHWAYTFNALNGYLYLPTPSEWLVIPPSTVWCARFAAAPATLTGWNVTLVYEELI